MTESVAVAAQDVQQVSFRSPEAKALHACFCQARERNPAFSLRAFARQLGVQASLLSEIFRGKRGVSSALARRVQERFGVALAAEAFPNATTFWLPLPQVSCERLLGRTELLTEVRRHLLTPGPRVVVLLGPFGCGKTALSLALVQGVALQRAFPDGIVWINGHDAASLRASLEGCAARLGCQQSELAHMSSAELREWLRAAFLNRKCLFVIDDLSSAQLVGELDFVGPFSARLMNSTEGDVAESIPAGLVVPVGPLQADTRVSLFWQEARGKEHSDPSRIPALPEWPLDILLLAKAFRRSKDVSLAPAAAIRVLARDCSRGCAAPVRLLAFLPAWPASFPRSRIVAALERWPLSASAFFSAKLLCEHGQSCSIPPSVSVALREDEGPLEASDAELFPVLCELLFESPEWDGPRMLSLYRAFRAEGADEIAAMLAFWLGRHHREKLHDRAGSIVYFLEAEGCSNPEVAQGATLCLAQEDLNSGRLPQARQRLQTLRAGGVLALRVRSTLAEIALRAGALDEAESHYRQVVQDAVDSEGMLFHGLVGLARILVRQRRWREAADLLVRARALAGVVPVGASLAGVFLSEAQCLQGLCQFRAAMRSLDHAAAICRRHGNGQLLSHTEILRSHLLVRLGMIPEARAGFLTMRERAGGDVLLHTNALFGLVECAIAEGRAEEAMRLLAPYEPASEMDRFDLKMSWAAAHRLHGNLIAAQEAWAEAEAVLAGTYEALQEKRLLLEKAEILLHAGELANAQAAAVRLEKLARAGDDTFFGLQGLRVQIRVARKQAVSPSRLANLVTSLEKGRELAIYQECLEALAE